MADISSLFGLGSAVAGMGGLLSTITQAPPPPLPMTAQQLMQAQAKLFNQQIDQSIMDALIAGSGFTHTKPALPDPTETREIAGPILALRGWLNREKPGGESGLYPVGWDCVKWAPRHAPRAQNVGYHKEGGYWGLRFKEDIPDAPLHGIVSMWGEIVQHERGFRAEFAYPVVIWPTSPFMRPESNDQIMPGFPEYKPDYGWVEAIAEEYGIEWLKCAPWEELEEVA